MLRIAVCAAALQSSSAALRVPEAHRTHLFGAGTHLFGASAHLFGAGAHLFGAGTHLFGAGTQVPLLVLPHPVPARRISFFGIYLTIGPI